MNGTTLLCVCRRTIVCCLLLLFSEIAWGHAFPEHQIPGAGSVLTTPPKMIKIWFDGDLEPIFSTIKVKDSEDNVVAKAAVAPGQSDPKLLQVSLPRLGQGSYHVIWSVVGRDGHRTEGDFTFSMKS